MTRATCLAALFLMFAPLSAQEPDYAQWSKACARLPANRELKGRRPDNSILPLRTFGEFERPLTRFLAAERKGPLADAKSWVGKPPDPKDFFDPTRTWYAESATDVPFQPFAQKLVLPGDAVAIVQGDLHGDVRSLLRMLDELNRRKILDGFKLRDDKHHLLFLGDYCDRGAYGAEVLYTLLRLKDANEKQVHLVRGNHEDFNMIGRYGFLDELLAKYGQTANVTKLMRAYDLLPVVLYVGDGRDFLQMNHGGMEPGYDPKELLASSGAVRYQLLGPLRQRTYHKTHAGWLGNDPTVLAAAERQFRDFTPRSPTSPSVVGFMWNDFTVFADEPALGYERSHVFGAGPTRHILKQASTESVRVRAVVRAHQHVGALNPLMSRLVAHDGLFRHWQDRETSANAEDTVAGIRDRLPPEENRPIPDGSVWTFNVSPDSVYGAGCGYDFVTAGVLTLAADFKSWRIRVLKLKVL
jgi:Calcineurin-like phosphoesterase